MADDVDENDTAVNRDRAASTKSAFEAGNYVKDSSGNLSYKNPSAPVDARTKHPGPVPKATQHRWDR